MASQNMEKEAKGFVCSNSKCQISFATPILVQDLSSEDDSPYYACPRCLTEIQETRKDEGKKRKHKVKTPTAETLQTEKPTEETTSKETGCRHHFGYLSQRPKTEKMPEECMLCPKILECMLAQLKRDISSPQIKVNADKDETAEEPVEKDLETEIEDDAEPRTDVEPTSRTPSEDQFRVENLGMLHASWTDTVRIDKQRLKEWGKEVKKVEIEAADGKKVRCKVQSMEGSKGTIEMPDKLQSRLEISRGQFVKVRPVGRRN